MLEKIVVGYDGGETGAEALALASSFAHAFGSELIVAYGYDKLVASVSPDAAAELEAHVRDVFAHAASQLDHSLRFTMCELPGESPARQLLELAEDEPADLIVVGSRRLGALQRITTGSVSDSILHGAPCAVAVAPRGYETPHHGLRRIVVGWIPTAEADAALRLAHALAAHTGGRLTVVSTVTAKSAFPVLGAAAFVYDQLLEDLCTGAKRDVEAIVAELGGAVPVAVEAKVAGGVEELVGQSADADLVVLGSRGYGPIRRVLLGGVSTAVVREAQCPVLVLPRSSTDAHAHDDAAAQAQASAEPSA